MQCFHRYQFNIYYMSSFELSWSGCRWMTHFISSFSDFVWIWIKADTENQDGKDLFSTCKAGLVGDVILFAFHVFFFAEMMCETSRAGIYLSYTSKASLVVEIPCIDKQPLLLLFNTNDTKFYILLFLFWDTKKQASETFVHDTKLNVYRHCVWTRATCTTLDNK